MAETKVARRYAKSLLDLGKENNSTDVLNNDMILVAQTLKANRGLAAMLKSPVIHGFKKDAVLKEIFDGKLSETSLEFMRLITRKNREYYIDAISKSFIELYKAYKNIQPAQVTTATPIDAKLREEMVAIVKKATGSTVELHEVVDPKIIGGFILRWDDNQIDSSVTTRLSSLKRNFSKSFIQK